jgi:hypothetical protein
MKKRPWVVNLDEPRPQSPFPASFIPLYFSPHQAIVVHPLSCFATLLVAIVSPHSTRYYICTPAHRTLSFFHPFFYAPSTRSISTISMYLQFLLAGTFSLPLSILWLRLHRLRRPATFSSSVFHLLLTPSHFYTPLGLFIDTYIYIEALLVSLPISISSRIVYHSPSPMSLSSSYFLISGIYIFLLPRRDASGLRLVSIVITAVDSRNLYQSWAPMNPGIGCIYFIKPHRIADERRHIIQKETRGLSPALSLAAPCPGCGPGGQQVKPANHQTSSLCMAGDARAKCSRILASFANLASLA